MYSISFSADQRYVTPSAGMVPAYESAVQVSLKPIRLVNLYAFNKDASVVYLCVADSSDAGVTTGVSGAVPIPVPPGGFIGLAQHGGIRMSKGLYLKAFTDLGLSVAAGNLMFYKADWIDAV